VTSGEVTIFAAKILNSGGRDGVLVCANGVSGQPRDNAHHEIAVALTRGIRIHVLTAAQIAALEATEDLVNLLRAIHLHLRMKQVHP
jgi:hypothetical protein